MRRRLLFAAPLVITAPLLALAACGGGAGAAKPTANTNTLPDIPPETLQPPAHTCDGVVPEAPCETGDRCQIDGNPDGCGLNGYECRDGKWHELMTFCNPPPPT